MRDAGFRHPERTLRTGGVSRHARLAIDARPPAARLGDDDAANAPTNRDEDDDDLSSSSLSESESPPPLSSALAVPSRLLARLSPRRVAEHRAFRHLARAARRLDLVASTRARRAETTRHLKRAWRVARLLAERDPTLAPLLPLLASSLRADAAAEATFSRLKNEAREGLRDAAKRLAVFAAKNAFAAEALRDLSETYTRAERARKEKNEDATDDASRTKRTPKTIRATRRPLRSDEFSLTNAHARFHEGLSVVETSLADRAFAALAGADPRAKVFSPSAKTVFRDETREDVFFSARDDRDGDRSDPGPEPEPDPNDDDDKNETETVTETTERPRVAIAAIARPFVYPERRMRLEERVERGATKTTEEKRLSTSFGDDEKEHCFSQSELLTSSQREAIEGDGGQNHGSVRLETVDFLDQAVRATQTQSPRSLSREDET
jgi:hypothetical protein